MAPEPLRLIREALPGRPAGAPAAFLDRDGVLNEVIGDGGASVPPRSIDDVRWVEGAHEAVRLLEAAGFVTLVVTNQPDVSRGTLDLDVALAITRHTVEGLRLDGGYVCPHDGGDGCSCRKPGSGMLLEAVDDWNVDLARSWLVGDRWVDIGAAAAAGVRSILVERSYSWSPSSAGHPPAGLRPTFTVSTILEAARTILSELGR